MFTTLNVIARCVMLRIRKVLASRILSLKGQGDCMVWKDHVCNCVPCHLPNKFMRM